DLRLRRLETTNGVLRVQSRQIPLSFFGEDVKLSGRYDTRRARYDLRLSCGRFQQPEQPPAHLDGSAQISVGLERNRLVIESASLKSNQSSISVTGQVKDFANPVMDLRSQAKFAAADLVAWWPASEW